jgi:hypothetical protein
MKIRLNSEIEMFLAECWENIQNDTKNDFVGMHVTKASERKVQKAMAEAGFAEFQGDPSTWPSLFLSVEDWENSPYHSHISLDLVKGDHFSYVNERTAGRELFNADCIQKDPERRLNDWMKLRAMDQNFNAIYLYQDEEDWMLDAPSEAATNDVPASKAHGKVLTFGLGIGYFLYMALANPAVQSVTVVENSPQVISMFERFLLPQFPQDKPIRIIEGDAFDLFSKEYLDQYDYIYTDIWKSSDDGLKTITKLLKQYCLPVEKGDFWIEDSCFGILWVLSYFCFDEIAHGTVHETAPEYMPYLEKIRRHYAKSEETVTSVSRLQELMYDNANLRSILGEA